MNDLYQESRHEMGGHLVTGRINDFNMLGYMSQDHLCPARKDFVLSDRILRPTRTDQLDSPLSGICQPKSI